MKLLTKQQKVDLHIHLHDKNQPVEFQIHLLDEPFVVGLMEPI